MKRKIALTNRGRAMATEDAILSVTVAFARYDKVMPAVAGLFRAAFGYALAEENPGISQIARTESLNITPRQPNVMHIHSVLVSEPEGALGITLIEDWYGPRPGALGSLLPDVDLLSLLSQYEDKTCERHRFTWRTGPDVLREVDLDRNMSKPGWCWRESGEVQPWEDARRLGERALSKRIDRALLVEYAAALGVDLHAALGAQRLERSVYLWQISGWDARPGLTPTTLGQDYHHAAVLAGFGTGECDRTFDAQSREALAAQRAKSAYEETVKRLWRRKSAAGLLRVMDSMGPPPEDDFGAYMRLLTWSEAMRIAYRKFPQDTEIAVLEDRAIAETAHQEYALTRVRLNDMRLT